MKTVVQIAAFAVVCLLTAPARAAFPEADPEFNPGVTGQVYCAALQPDGKIVLGGDFSVIAGTSRRNAARLLAGGALDEAFAPEFDGPVHTLAVRKDGMIFAGGDFTSVNGQSRTRI